MKRLLHIIWLFPALSLSGCYYDVEEELHPMACDTTASAYSSSVEVILQTNCYSCHAGSVAMGSVILDSYSNARTWALNGKLRGAIRHDAGFSPMPKNSDQLSSCDIATIERWINNGAPNN